jgi:oligoribonuclease (3'-5' exoribonuclease)
MNTEIRKALKNLRDAETVVRESLEGGGLTTAERDHLSEVMGTLTDLDNFLVLEDLNSSIDQLEEKSKKLQDLNKRTQESIAKLERVAKAVGIAAKVVDGIAKACGILLKAGLL